MTENVNTHKRKIIVAILKASTKIAIEYKRGPANYVRVPLSVMSYFPDRDVAGITVYDDIDLKDTIIVGRTDEDILIKEIIKII